jgi:hypothetical protein
MKQTSTRTISQTLLLGIIGAGLGTGLGLPVAPLLGSALLVSIVTLMGIRTGASHSLRNFSFIVVGCSLGCGITPETLALVGHWPWSLAALALTITFMMYANVWLLVRFYGQSVETSLLASSPGALSSVIALATSGYGNARAIMVLQGMRLLLVMALLPVIIEGLNLQGTTNAAVLHGVLDYAYLPTLIISSYVLAAFLDKINFPAAYIMAGLIISALGHSTELMQGVMPNPLVIIAFIIIGSSVGTRFNGMQHSELKRYAGAAIASVTLSSIIAAVAAFIMAKLLQLPFGQVWVAYAPGGVEAMAALAMALHFDPAYVAVHHLARIIGLVLVLPLVMTWLRIKPNAAGQ